MSSICIPPCKSRAVYNYKIALGAVFSQLSGKGIALWNGLPGLLVVEPKEGFHHTHCSFALSLGPEKLSRDTVFSTLIE